MGLTTPQGLFTHPIIFPPWDRSVSFNLLSEFESTLFFGSQIIFPIMIKQIPLISFKSWYVTEPGFEHTLQSPSYVLLVPITAHHGTTVLASEWCWWLFCQAHPDSREISAFYRGTEWATRGKEIWAKGSQDGRNKNGSWCPFFPCLPLSTHRCFENIPLSFSVQTSRLSMTSEWIKIQVQLLIQRRKLIVT